MTPNHLPAPPNEQSAPVIFEDDSQRVLTPVDDVIPNLPTREQHPETVTAVRRAAGWLALRFRGDKSNQHEGQPLDEADQAVVATLETQHFVRDAPRFSELVTDTSRTNLFTTYVDTESTRRREYDGTMDNMAPRRTLTAHQGISETYDFLVTAAHMAAEAEATQDIATASLKARTILEELHFIDDRELDEATKGFAALWKSKLLADPSHKLCVPNVIGDTETMNKSGSYIFERVMGQFSDEERAQFGPRISTSLRELKGKPENTTVVLLEDWSISGTQLATGYGDIISDRRYSKWSKQVEVHLIAASTEQLENSRLQGRPVPTIAYFRCDQIRKSHSSEPVITGIHSSVDFGFEKEIEYITTVMNQRPNQPKVMMPPLTNIVRPYRS